MELRLPIGLFLPGIQRGVRTAKLTGICYALDVAVVLIADSAEDVARLAERARGAKRESGAGGAA
jgi:hypothetical protein